MPRRLKEVIPEALRQAGGGERLRRGLVLAAWREVVGRELAGLTEAVALEGGVLTVRVPDPVTAHSLTYNRLALLRRYGERFPGVVREIRFVVGQVARPLPPSPPAPEEGGASRQAWRLVQEAPPGLRTAAARAALALLQRRRGEPCPICESPSEAHPCPTCRRHLASPAVRKGAERLKRGRPPGLEGEALLVARHLAKEALRREMAELFPQALREASLRPLLRDLAQRFQALFPEEPLPDGLKSLLAKDS